MSGRWAYVDSSAFVKLCWAEDESKALTAHVGKRPLISSQLLRIEVNRAAMRRTLDDVAIVREELTAVEQMAMTAPVVELASTIQPPTMRSVDAIHIASALLLEGDLEELITYDERMREAALAQGLMVTSPR